MALSFQTLRIANLARLPLFKNSKGKPAHTKPDGSDWTVAQWVQATLGELGEFANLRKKFERGDITIHEYSVAAAKELADIQTYLDLLAARALDHTHPDGTYFVHPTGIELGRATVQKWNEVSARVDVPLRIDHLGDRVMSAEEFYGDTKPSQ